MSAAHGTFSKIDYILGHTKQISTNIRKLKHYTFYLTTLEWSYKSTGKETTENVKVTGIKQHTVGWWMGYLRNIEENLQVPTV